MSSEIWLSELEDNRLKLESLAVKLCEKIKEIYIKQNIKIIVTYRIKSKESLSEKIKRHNVDNERNKDRSIFEVFNDIIGIRIICMKINDEKQVCDKLKDYIEMYEENNIKFNENINNQPTNQKNGHAIYKFDGMLIDEGINLLFELQIKSLANLFWGEMEHLLFYKNSKVLISNKYYEKEINSIFDELKNIDNKLTYMEEAMMSESDDDLLEEKIEVFKRYAYLQLKEPLRKEFDDYLNNKYIFNAVGDYIFRTNVTSIDSKGNRVAKDPNEILRKILYVLLDHERGDIDFSKFNFENIQDTKLNIEIRDFLIEIVKERQNGWWIYIVLCGIFSYYQEGIDISLPVESHLIKEHINVCIKNLCNSIYKEVDLYTKLIEIDSKFSKQEIRKITQELVKKFLNSCKINKNLKFAEKKYANNYNLYGIKLIKELDAKNLGIIESLYENSDFIQSIHSILINIDNINNIITSHVKLLDQQVYETLKVHLENMDKYFITNNDITVETFFKLLEGGDENEK